MSIDLTFKQVCEYVKKDDPKLIDAIDKLLGVTIACSPLFLGPAAIKLLPLIAVKNELTKAGKSVYESVTKKKDNDYVARLQRMEMAYGLICFTAFYEALDRQLPQQLRDKIGLLKNEKEIFAKKALEKIDCSKDELTNGVPIIQSNNIHSSLFISFPHPTETFTQQVERHSQLWKQMSHGFRDFIFNLAFWEKAKEKEQAIVNDALEMLPVVAAQCFESQYFELVRVYEDFAVWSNLHEHKGTKALINQLSDYVKNQSSLCFEAKSRIDIGFNKLHEVVQGIPEMLKIAQATDIVESLTRHYKARINDPIAIENDEIEPEKPHLRFPRISDAFVPQSFMVLRFNQGTNRLEDPTTWRNLERRDDLGAFILNYLSSPYSTETPLVILGHPGSGKSLLTTILSAQLMSQHYVAIRVPLREVDAEAGIVAQIEEQIQRVTNQSVDSWAKISGGFKNCPPLVILDGYDELLQASGKVFSGYLKEVQNFQKNESELGRPVRVIVTSRITLIDKATIPTGSTVIRLLEFDKTQRDCWISIWNAENMSFFKEVGINEFSLPKEEQSDGSKILALAEQPLLLLMLALYDSQDNKLKKSKSLDRTKLYDSLLRQFVDRERTKDKSFDELEKVEKKKELDAEMQRLAVAALGMYNRRKLHILSPELNDDIKFFDLERSISVTSGGRTLTQADLLLGSFFFVHKSKAQLKAGVPEHHQEAAAFEFLHNTFNEFLTADFILHHALSEVATIKALQENEVLKIQLEQRLVGADGTSRAWLASLVYTPLFTRPVVLQMMREWIIHLLKHKHIDNDEFVLILDKIILNQIRRLLTKREMPSIIRKEMAQEGYRTTFGDLPLLGHIAIYSINLILLRIIVSNKPFVFDEQEIGTHEDGTRPWDRLTHIWRSWFSLDNLNGLAAIMQSCRQESQITVLAKDGFLPGNSQNRLETCLNVAISLSDNISSGLTGLLAFDPMKENQLNLNDISNLLVSEKIDLEFHLLMLKLNQDEIYFDSEKYFHSLYSTISLALDSRKYIELEQIAISLRRVLRRITYGDDKKRSFDRAGNLLGDLVHPKLVAEIASQNPQAATIILQVIKEIAGPGWSRRYGRDFLEIGFHKREYPLDIMKQRPDLYLEWLQLMREIGGRNYLRHFGRKFRHKDFPDIFLNPRHLIDLIEHNTALVIPWVKFMREIVGVRFFEGVDEDFIRMDAFDLILNPDYVYRLFEQDSDAALLLIQFARELDEKHFFNRFDINFLEHVILTHIFGPHYLDEFIERDPDSILFWFKLTVEVIEKVPIRDHLTNKLHSDDYLERMMSPRYLVELIDINPKIASIWFKIFLLLNNNSFPEKMAEGLFEEPFNPAYLRRLLIYKTESFAIPLSIARSSRSKHGINNITNSLLELLNFPDNGKNILESFPLSTIANLRWLIENTRVPELKSLIKKILDPINDSM